ncbi:MULTISPECIES: class I SAM-dependent methyltransferase [unclassified Pseudomonas]|uniref:class I SAM-dependent methyltransferase n=1 Tax=unclassified Pseudomonas TaxID=196821 RepID=UPI002B23DAFC|nr:MULTISPECIES: class I SAM-dependent methyltransferase [unclassified Pseudomonas]MEA9976865.1 class I SAM-dependent methyltransferase [Pseudomonas sp. RTS4]MEB0196793.1 class I SAM-dependent methyltransferase [Pseudomonas sp. 5S4]MEB0244252.1 class I SAM-dependent methyltransferase [Pseudomonas sp. 10S5]
MTNPVKLNVLQKYGEANAQHYFRRCQGDAVRRLSHWRDEQLARKALVLAGEPTTVLDLPCGLGRSWRLLAEKANRVIIAADSSAVILQTACDSQPLAVVKRIRTLQISLFDIELPENSVDCIFCMHLLHHIGDARHRAALLEQLNRVTRDTVIISLWVDGNFSAWKRKRQEQLRLAQGKQSGHQNCFVIPVKIAESEFVQAGFDIQNRLNFLPLYAMWRVYVLRKKMEPE